MHLFDVGRGFYGGYGIVGGHLPLATGAAYALRYHGTDRVCLCFLGDGAINTGAFHEAVNLAGVWGRDALCPVVYIVENNQYGMGTSVERSSAVVNLSTRFGAYAIEHERVDGMDFMTVRALAARVIAQVRASGRPYAVEVLTSRFAGHGAADLFQPYRSKEGIAKTKGRDPITVLERQLRDAGVLNEADVKRAQDDAARVVQEAVQFAEGSPEPEPDALFTDIYGMP
jgi:pyruvate dehydrogenase E1 component alpha subunit